MAPRLSRHAVRREGVTALETAFVLPVLIALILAVVLLGYGVLLRHQVNHIAREASRWAAVHGAQYAKAKAKGGEVVLTSPKEVYDGPIKRHAAGMRLSALTYTVEWSDAEQRPYVAAIVGGSVVSRATTVTVTINYVWNTGAIAGPITVSSTSVSPVSY